MQTKNTIYVGELRNTSLGDFRLAASTLGLVAVEWAFASTEFDSCLARLRQPLEDNQKQIAIYANQIKEYLNRKRKTFSISIDWTHFTDFQRSTLKEVLRIPYGETRTYAAIAKAIKHPNAYRAVGAANAMNPMPIVIPCHRVLGSDGKLHGYGGGDGLPTKQWLLDFEHRNSIS